MLLSKVKSGSIVQMYAVHNLEEVKLPKTKSFLGYLLKRQIDFGKKWIPFPHFEKNTRLRIRWILDNLQAINGEIYELYTWLPWAYWQEYSNFEFQMNEFKYALSDILHFVITGMATVDLDSKLIIKIYKGLLKGLGVELTTDKKEPFSLFFEHQKILEKGFLEKVKTTNELLEFLQRQIIGLVYQVETIRELLPWKHWKVYENYIYPARELQVAYVDLLVCLVSLMISVEMDTKEAMKIYESKHQQNILRQKRRY